jgi:hypothetical protein
MTQRHFYNTSRGYDTAWSFNFTEHFGEHPEDGDSKLFRKFGTHLPEHRVLKSRRLQYKYPPQ